VPIGEVWREPSRGEYPDPILFAKEGVDLLRALYQVPHPLGRLTGIVMDEASEQQVTFSMPATDWFVAAQGHIFAGALLVLADYAAGSAVTLGLSAGMPSSTFELSLTFLKPCPNGGRLSAVGTPISNGSRLAVAAVSILDGGGGRVALGTSTSVVQPPGTAGTRPTDQAPAGSPPRYDSPDPYLRPACGSSIPSDEWQSMGGADILARQIAGDRAHPPLHYLTGMTIREASNGKALLSLPALRWLTSGARTVLGGVVAMLAHAALVSAVTSTLDAQTIPVPMDVKVNFLRPVLPDDTDLMATGVVTHRGRTLAVANAEVVTATGKKVAVATGSTMIISAGA